ncbi:3-keto-disaccharide hydrolase [Pontibacter chitinilyticus]|uniref:3-keto-disaccharide hydrolase n=1 Tax=Pontibacter chitinilyticus TaxID=2674989 RepID=UPI0032196346
MKRHLLTLLPLAALMLGCQSEQQDTTADNANATAPTETQDGWIPLFNGKNLESWHSYGQSTAGKAWEVEDSTIHLATTNPSGGEPIKGGDLVTDESFEDFDLKLDWKISPKGNSGIIFYVHEDTAKYKETWNTGLEMQVLDNNGHPDAQIVKHRAGDLYDLIASSSEPVKPAGEWNHAEIISNDGKLDLYLNGTKVVTTTLWDDNWKKMVADSKFSSMPDFGTFKSGKIALQDHGHDVWFRNIMIKRL